MILDKNSLEKWFKDNGDFTHNLNHNLNQDSIVVDIGSYTGVWISQMIDIYDCKYYAIEPIKKYYDVLNFKFSHTHNVIAVPVGISNKKEIVDINIDSDASSILMANSGSQKQTEKIILIELKDFINKFNISNIDLLQINVEGYEYQILNNWIETGIIKKIKKLQIQFHEVEAIDCKLERAKIQNKLEQNGFKKIFDYPFVWEAWEK